MVVTPPQQRCRNNEASSRLHRPRWSWAHGHLSGRYYAMDRDRRWDRVKRAYDVMTQDGPGDGRSVVEVLQDSYAEKSQTSSSSQSDCPRAVEPGDGVIFLTSALIEPDNSPMLWSRRTLTALKETNSSPLFCDVYSVRAKLPVLVAFAPQNLKTS